jgi:hypothetical protein
MLPLHNLHLCRRSYGGAVPPDGVEENQKMWLDFENEGEGVLVWPEFH